MDQGSRHPTEHMLVASSVMARQQLQPVCAQWDAGCCWYHRGALSPPSWSTFPPNVQGWSGWVCYNDETPAGSTASGAKYAHAKGILACEAYLLGSSARHQGCIAVLF